MSKLLRIDPSPSGNNYEQIEKNRTDILVLDGDIKTIDEKGETPETAVKFADKAFNADNASNANIAETATKALNADIADIANRLGIYEANAYVRKSELPKTGDFKINVNYQEQPSFTEGEYSIVFSDEPLVNELITAGFIKYTKTPTSSTIEILKQIPKMIVNYSVEFAVFSTPTVPSDPATVGIKTWIEKDSSGVITREGELTNYSIASGVFAKSNTPTLRSLEIGDKLSLKMEIIHVDNVQSAEVFVDENDAFVLDISVQGINDNGILDAPQDGKLYLRKYGEWVEAKKVLKSPINVQHVQELVENGYSIILSSYNEPQDAYLIISYFNFNITTPHPQPTISFHNASGAWQSNFPIEQILDKMVYWDYDIETTERSK